jgi:hypothetical protein
MAPTPRSLADAIALLEQRYGTGALRRGGDPVAARTWSTGLPVIDEQLLAGGLPIGLVTVIAGERPAGRSEGATGRLSLLQGLLAIASQQMQAVYVDLPGTADPGFLFDFGLHDSCLFARPRNGAIGQGLAMARTLILAGVPWVGVALPHIPQGRPAAWSHPLTALAAAAKTARAVLCVSAPAPLPTPLAHASSLTIACRREGWHLVHGDVDGIRVALSVTKSKVGAPGATATALVRYPRPHAVPEVVGLPTVLTGVRNQPYAVLADEFGHSADHPHPADPIVVTG